MVDTFGLRAVSSRIEKIANVCKKISHEISYCFDENFEMVSVQFPTRFKRIN